MKLILKGEDFDIIIKSFYKSAMEEKTRLEEEGKEEELEGFKLACEVFDKVITAYKRSNL